MSKYVLGINLSHDPSCCLLKDGVPIIAINEERLNRIKKYHTPKDKDGCFWKTIAPLSLKYCLNYEGITLKDIECVVCSTTIVDNTKDNIQRNLTREDIIPQLDIDPDRIHVINHHLSHAASCFFASGYDHSAILISDGWGSLIPENNKLWECTTLYKGNGNDIKLLKSCPDAIGTSEFDFSYSLGALYTSVTRYVGFRNTEEGKTMGMSPFGKESGMWDLFKTQFILNDPDTIYKLKPALRYFKEYFDESSYERLFEILFGKPKLPGEKHRKDDLNIAYSVQRALEEIILNCVDWLHKETGETNLCMAGGVSLNSVTNKLILDRTPIMKLFVQPASSDDGVCFGNALYGWRVIMNQPSNYVMKHAYLGRPYTEPEINKAMRKRNGVKILGKGNIEEKTAKLLADKYILGWFQGGSEFGPRALGHRSIITDARGDDTKDILNKRVKHREAFRPFAPACPLENSKEYFDIDCESPYMLLIADVHEDKRKLIPAITHIDGTARLQTVTEEDNGSYYRMIKKFGELTGTPVILNTSFNDAGEPIVETPEDAIRCFLSTNIDYLVIEDYLLGKSLFGRFKGWFIDKYEMTRKKLKSKFRAKREIKKRMRWESNYTWVDNGLISDKLPFFLKHKPEYIVSMFKENIIKVEKENDNFAVNLPYPVRLVWNLSPDKKREVSFDLQISDGSITDNINLFVLHIVDSESKLIYKKEYTNSNIKDSIKLSIPDDKFSDSVSQIAIVVFGNHNDKLSVKLINPDLRILS